MSVVEIPRRDAGDGQAKEAADRLRKLAAEIEVDPSVRGLMVIVDRGSHGEDNFRTMRTGILEKSRERAFWAVSRIMNWMVSRDT